MGAVGFSFDVGLVQALRQGVRLEVFVETGTFKGDTVALVDGLFGEIHSVELIQAHYEAAQNRFAGRPHVDLVCGESAVALRGWRPVLSGRSVLYFLDAHWCVTECVAECVAECVTESVICSVSQCPLLDELSAIGELNAQSVVVVDDARLFLAPPPEPHVLAQWPTFSELLAALRRLAPAHRLILLNDTLVLYPEAAHVSMLRYARSASIDLLAAMGKVRDYDNLRLQFDGLQRQLEEKEQAIGDLKRVCDQREAVIRSLRSESATEQLPEKQMGGASSANVLAALRDLQTQLAESRQVADETRQCNKGQLEALLFQQLVEYRERCRQQEHVINQFQQHSWRYRLRSRIARHLAQHCYPKLGRLWHHDPVHIQAWGLPPAPRYEKRLAWPRISLVTPSFGQAAFIGRTIDSVLDQRYPNLQYFVQDGGSCDGTVDVLKSYEGRLSGWVSEKDNGQSQAINRGFARTDGEIMAWLNSDDLLMGGALAYVADYFMRHPEVDVVYGHRVLVDVNDLEIGRWILPGHSGAALKWADFIPQETLFWRRSIWEKAGGTIDETFRFAMDWDLLLRMQNAGARMVRLPKFLGAFRIHEAQKTSSAINEIGMAEMDRLRRREFGRDVERREIHRGLIPYLIAHVAHDVRCRGGAYLFSRQSSNVK